MSRDKQREAFEASRVARWHPDAKGPGMFDRDPYGGYYNTAVHAAWLAWKASRSTALDEAARAMRPELRSMLSRGEAHDIILALKEQA